MKLLPLILRNLMRNRRRTLLTILSIAVSVFMFGALMSLPTLVEEILRDRADSVRIITMAKTGMTYSLPSAYVAKVHSLPRVEAVTGESLFLATYRDPKDLVPAVSVDPTQVEALFPDFDIKPAEAEELRQTRSGALVGTELMNGFHWHVGDNLILHGVAYAIDLQLKIVGTVGGKAPPAAVLIRQDFLNEALGRPDTVGLIYTRAESSKAVPAVAAAIDEMFANSPSQTISQSEVSFARNMIRNYRLIFDGMKFVAVIVVLTIALVAGNTASMAVRERRHELAIIRSMGFTRGTVISSLTVEGALIGLISGMLGGALAYGILRLTPHLAHSLGPLAYRITFVPNVAFEGLLIAIAIGTVSTLVPALVEGRREISSELRAIV